MTQPPNPLYRISAKALILDDQKRFLLVQEDNGRWELPGGGLDFGETPAEGIKREIQEEMGIEVTWVADHPSYFTTTKGENGMWLANVLYETKVKNLDLTPSNECVACRFFTIDESNKLDAFENVTNFASIFDPKKH